MFVMGGVLVLAPLLYMGSMVGKDNCCTLILVVAGLAIKNNGDALKNFSEFIVKV